MLHQYLKEQIVFLTKKRRGITVNKNWGSIIENVDVLCLYQKIWEISIEGNNLPVNHLTYTSLIYVRIKSASNSESEYFKVLYNIYFFTNLSRGLSQKLGTILDFFPQDTPAIHFKECQDF